MLSGHTLIVSVATNRRWSKVYPHMWLAVFSVSVELRADSSRPSPRTMQPFTRPPPAAPGALITIVSVGGSRRATSSAPAWVPLPLHTRGMSR